MKPEWAKAPSPDPDQRKLVVLAPVLDLKAVAPLADELIALRGYDVTVDGAGVQRVGAQCLQVLLAARRTWAADQVEFAIVAASEQLQATATLLGTGATLFDTAETRS